MNHQAAESTARESQATERSLLVSDPGEMMSMPKKRLNSEKSVPPAVAGGLACRPGSSPAETQTIWCSSGISSAAGEPMADASLSEAPAALAAAPQRALGMPAKRTSLRYQESADRPESDLAIKPS